MKVAILTSTHLRHRYFVHTLAQSFNVALVVREVKRDAIAPQSTSGTPIVIDSADAMKRHLLARDTAEVTYFGDTPSIAHLNVMDVPTGEINSNSVYVALDTLNPDWVILYGTGIIQTPILQRFEGRVLNMHLGLSPYYRGAGTNFWPLVNGEPECVGVTLHYAVLKVDAGPILHQVRPSMASDDGPHDIGCNTIMAGTQGMVEVLTQLARGPVAGQLQDLSGGRVYKRADFNPEAVKTLYETMDNGLISTYLAQKSQRDQAFPLVTLPQPVLG